LKIVGHSARLVAMTTQPTRICAGQHWEDAVSGVTGDMACRWQWR